jgi:hypothetical protein
MSIFPFSLPGKHPKATISMEAGDNPTSEPKSREEIGD